MVYSIHGGFSTVQSKHLSRISIFWRFKKANILTVLIVIIFRQQTSIKQQLYGCNAKCAAIFSKILTNWKKVSSWLLMSRYSVDVKNGKNSNSKIKHGNSHRNIRNRGFYKNYGWMFNKCYLLADTLVISDIW